MKTLIELFTENYKPYAVVPILGLSKTFILKNGFLEKDIQSLINSGEIEKSGESGYRLTKSFIKKWSESSYKYIPKFAK